MSILKQLGTDYVRYWDCLLRKQITLSVSHLVHAYSSLTSGRLLLLIPCINLEGLDFLIFSFNKPFILGNVMAYSGLGMM